METTPMHSSFNKSARSGRSAAPQTAKSSSKGFTLIELLVVITIIAVLAGLLFPAMGAVRTQARKASAKNDVTQLVNAIKAYHLEYGKYPNPNNSTTKTKITANGPLVGILRASSDTNNPREIRFLEVPTAKNNRSGLVISGSGSTAAPTATAEWNDPWGHPYQIFIAYDYQPYNSNVSVTGRKKGAGGATVAEEKAISFNGEVGAASSGNPEGTTADPVVSWQ